MEGAAFSDEGTWASMKAAAFFDDGLVVRLPSEPLHGEVDQLLLPLVGVRRHEEIDGGERDLLIEHAARVREGFEAEEAVGLADAAVPDAAERQLELVEVNQGVIDDRAARARACEDPF